MSYTKYTRIGPTSRGKAQSGDSETLALSLEVVDNMTDGTTRNRGIKVR